jgi:hypothetical protein
MQPSRAKEFALRGKSANHSYYKLEYALNRDLLEKG